MKRNIIGQRYGKLIVIAEGSTRIRPSGQKAAYWLCLCDCGEQREFCTGQLRGGHTKACGCTRTQQTISRNTKHGLATRGQRNSEYLAWKSMRQRCNNENNRDYPYYGGRGIRICDRWNEYANFLSDMGPRPSPTHSIDRIDVNGNYSPDNCRWATRLQQRLNRRDYIAAHGGLQ